MHVYLGALVFGVVFVATSMLVGADAPARIGSLRSVGFALSFFGATAVALTGLGVLEAPLATTAVAVLVGLVAAVGITRVGGASRR